MAKRVTDDRIGQRNSRGQVTKTPVRYATGELWNMTTHETPTTVYFGIEGTYFYVLPITVSRVNESIREDLLLSIPESMWHKSDFEFMEKQRLERKKEDERAEAIEDKIRIATKEFEDANSKKSPGVSGENNA